MYAEFYMLKEKFSMKNAPPNLVPIQLSSTLLKAPPFPGLQVLKVIPVMRTFKIQAKHLFLSGEICQRGVMRPSFYLKTTDSKC